MAYHTSAGKGVRSKVADALAGLGLLTCSLAVIATASLLAFWIR